MPQYMALPRSEKRSGEREGLAAGLRRRANVGIARRAIEEGRGLVLAVNKADLLGATEKPATSRGYGVSTASLQYGCNAIKQA